MKKLKKNIRPILILILIALFVFLAVYGLISLIVKITESEQLNGSISDKNLDNGSGNSEEPYNMENGSGTQKPSIEINKEINVEFSENSFRITNTRYKYSLLNRTGINNLIIFIEDSKCTELGYESVPDNDLVEGYIISEEKNGILVTVALKKPFTFIERSVNDELYLEITEQQNTRVLEYRNDLSRVYLNIHNARLSEESDSFIKKYTEIYDETNKIHTITIAKNLMPLLKDEIIILYDGTIKTIEISNRTNDIQLKFEVYERLNIYPNTRDYDAAFTFIKTKTSSTPLIVVDAGHGGIDGGTVSADKTITEKNIVLDICKYLSENLINMGFEVLNLREEDIYLGLMERTDIANIAKADAIISVHINSYKSKNVKGVQTYYKISDILAQNIQDAFLSETGANDMGIVKTMELSILNRAEMDSVIIETGFLTNEDELKLLITKEYQEKIANGIAKGIEQYFRKD